MDKKRKISTDEFFKLLSVSSGVDLRTVQDVYYGMTRMITRELKEKQVIKLPDWGEYVLKLYKSRITLDVQTRERKKLPAKLLVKFTPDYKVKKYFYEWGKSGL